MSVTATKQLTRAFGLDEIALVPSSLTLDPELVDPSTNIANIQLDVPIFASAMDSVVSPKTAGIIGKLGGAGILNLEGVQTRYENPEDVLNQISAVTNSDYVTLMQEIYQKEPIKDHLIKQRIKEIKDQGVQPVVSSTPQKASRL